MRYGMVVDLDRCIGCRTCAVICKDHNALPKGMWWNRVFVPGAPEYGTSVMVDGKPRMEFTPVSCQHCENAPCEKRMPARNWCHLHLILKQVRCLLITKNVSVVDIV